LAASLADNKPRSPNRVPSVGLLPDESGQKQTQKKLADTDAIFEELSLVNAAAESDAQTVRISMDAKATVKVGDFSRRGKKRVQVKAADHDAQTECHRDPGGHLSLPDTFFVIEKGI
jgi:hypothetical protein